MPSLTEHAERREAQDLAIGQAMSLAHGRQAEPGSAGASIAAILITGAVVLPLIFSVALTDVFAIPKTATLYVIVVLSLVALAVSEARAGWPAAVALGPLEVALLLFAALNVAATVLSPDVRQSLFGERLQYQGLLSLLCYPTSLLLARRALRGEREIRLFLAAVTLGGVLVSSYALIQQLGLDPLWHTLDKGRVFSTLGQANALAAYLVVAVPCAGAMMVICRGRAGRAAFGLAALLMLLVVVLTLSRGAYLGLLAASAVAGLLALRRLRRPRRMRTVALGSVVVGAAMALATGPAGPLFDRVVERAVSITASDGSARDHLDLWAVGVRIALDHPILGIGPERYPVVFAAYKTSVLTGERARFWARFRPESPHDVPLAIADGAGLPALAAYGVIVLLVLWRLVRTITFAPGGWIRTAMLGMTAAIAGHVVTDAFMTGEVTGTWLFWVELGVALRLVTLGRGVQAMAGERER